MNQHDTYGLRGILDGLPTAKLEQMLDEELQKKASDPAAVKLILSVLEDRDAAVPKTGHSVSEAARQKYRAQMEALFPPKPPRRWIPLLRVASAVLIIVLLFTLVPQQAEAETFWEMLQRLTNSMIHYLDRNEILVDIDHVFETDNPGLQQVYDACVELGVTEPMVPMWLPEGCELTELSTKSTPMVSRVHSSFSNGNTEIIYKLDVYEGEPAHQFYRDETYYDSYERNGATYIITRNNGWWTVVCTKDNLECHLTLDCQEETLRRILKSIYVMEGD